MCSIIQLIDITQKLLAIIASEMKVFNCNHIVCADRSASNDYD